MRTRESAHRPDMLGNISAAERPEKQGDNVPVDRRRERAVIAVRVTFEANRLAATYLATAYEQVVPLRRRRAAARTAMSCRQVERQPAERIGA